MKLKRFQQDVSTAIVNRYKDFINHEDRPGTKKREYPFFQSLAAITGSGKTPMLAQAIAQIRLEVGYSIEPLILWMTKSKVVVNQTYYNFIKGGKYENLLQGFEILNVKDFNLSLLSKNKPIILTLTTASFNNRDQEQGNLNLFKVSEDLFGNTSAWESIKNRNVEGKRRPLIIVYDEGHNLTQQQTELLESLSPEGYLVSSATLQFPYDFNRDVILPFKSWAEKFGKENYDCVTVNTNDVVQEQLIKKHIQFDGTTSSMEVCISNMIEQWRFLKEQSKDLNINPKAIYVCNTNIGDDGEKDDDSKPFNLREAPPIKIWRYLVNDLKINPQTIAIYTSELRVSDFPNNFNLFGKGDEDFIKFTSGNFQHIIFNQSLQEGWDDPECYLAYIDKNIKSKIKISQIIGRVLRQPNAQHYNKDGLNTAHFYIRVDRKETFNESIQEAQKSLGGVSLPSYSNNFDDSGQKIQLVDLSPRFKVDIGYVGLDFESIKAPINKIIKELTTYEETDSSAYANAEIFSKTLTLSENFKQTDLRIESDNKYKTRKVKLNWLIDLRLREKSSRLLNITETNSQEFRKHVSFGSMIDKLIISKAEEAYKYFVSHAKLDYMADDAFVFDKIKVKKNSLKIFQNSLYEGYSDFNSFELEFAEELDKTNNIWHRNSSRSGYSIPLLDIGDTQNFYTDFLVWKDDLIFSLDTKGAHLLTDALRRKLFDIKEGRTTKILTRFIAKGKYKTIKEKYSQDGYTVWIFRENQEVPIICETIQEAVEQSLYE